MYLPVSTLAMLGQRSPSRHTTTIPSSDSDNPIYEVRSVDYFLSKTRRDNTTSSWTSTVNADGSPRLVSPIFIVIFVIGCLSTVILLATVIRICIMRCRKKRRRAKAKARAQKDESAMDKEKDKTKMKLGSARSTLTSNGRPSISAGRPSISRSATGRPSISRPNVGRPRSVQISPTTGSFAGSNAAAAAPAPPPTPAHEIHDPHGPHDPHGLHGYQNTLHAPPQDSHDHHDPRMHARSPSPHTIPGAPSLPTHPAHRNLHSATHRPVNSRRPSSPTMRHVNFTRRPSIPMRTTSSAASRRPSSPTMGRLPYSQRRPSVPMHMRAAMAIRPQGRRPSSQTIWPGPAGRRPSSVYSRVMDSEPPSAPPIPALNPNRFNMQMPGDPYGGGNGGAHLHHHQPTRSNDMPPPAYQDCDNTWTIEEYEDEDVESPVRRSPEDHGLMGQGPRELVREVPDEGDSVIGFAVAVTAPSPVHMREEPVQMREWNPWHCEGGWV